MGRRSKKKGKRRSGSGKSVQGGYPASAHQRSIEAALVLQKKGAFRQAGDLYRMVLDNDPQHVQALHQLGLLTFRQGDTANAIDLLRRAIRSCSEDETLYKSLAGVLMKAGQMEEARRMYLKAMRISPGDFDACFNLGRVARRMGRLGEALDAYQKAAGIKNGPAEVYSDMGNILAEMGRGTDALACYQKAIQRDPAYAKAWNNMGSILKVQERYVEAIHHYCQAIEKDPQYAEAFNNLGAIITEMGKPDEAVKFFQRAIDLKPQSDLFLVNLYDALKRTCDWDRLSILDERLDALTKEAIRGKLRSIESPFLNLSRHDDPALNFDVARAWSAEVGRRMAGVGTPFDFQDRWGAGGKITLGYLSGNFRNHALGHLIAGLFQHHDSSRFNIFAYSTGEDDRSHYRRRIEQGSDRFVDIRSSDHLEAARRIYEDRVDILIDLMGYTKGGRMEIAALRPAPVQVRYMGMAGTTGANFFDYLIADSIVVPEADARYYSEKLVYLPDCYQVNDYQLVDGQAVPERTAVGLPGDACVFCSFNSAKKLDPVMYDAWMKILSSVPGSVLWLQAGNEAGEYHLRAEARRRGVHPERVVFGPKMDKSQHLARLKCADIGLDTRLVNGAATTSDALWSGVPVVSLRGRHFSSRMSSSILRAVGMQELITDSMDAYISLAIHYATHPSDLNDLKGRLVRNLKKKPLFDTNRFTGSLEHAFEQIWHHHLAAGHSRSPDPNCQMSCETAI